MSEQPQTFPDIARRLAVIRERIRAACAAAGRPPDAARLIAVSKGFPASALRAAAAAGQRDFGESYLQEALPKMVALSDEPLIWHFIGPIQSNKTRDIAGHFHWVHGVDRLRIAQRLSEQRGPQLPDLQVCVQVNVSGEASKSGCRPEEAPSLCRAIRPLPRLALRGLMAIPERAAGEPRAAFRKLRGLFETIRAELGPGFDTLSAGMSDDFEAAIAEGATFVRIGSAVFGERHHP